MFEPFVTRTGRRGRPTPHHRRSLNAIVWIMRTGAPWRDLPERYGRWDAVYKQFERWTKGGVWEVVLEALAESDPGAGTLQMVDATVVRAHHRAAGGRGGIRAQALGRSRGGFSSKIHARVDAQGRPLDFVLTPGERHEAKSFDALMMHADPWPQELLADKGYDDDGIRSEACSHGTNPLIPTKRNRTFQRFVPREKYSLRNRIERCFNRLKDCRRIATRYEKTARNFLAFIRLAAIRIWTKFVNEA